MEKKLPKRMNVCELNRVYSLHLILEAHKCELVEIDQTLPYICKSKSNRLEMIAHVCRK